MEGVINDALQTREKKNIGQFGRLDFGWPIIGWLKSLSSRPIAVKTMNNAFFFSSRPIEKCLLNKRVLFL